MNVKKLIKLCQLAIDKIFLAVNFSMMVFWSLKRGGALDVYLIFLQQENFSVYYFLSRGTLK
jgi:hypothetical protein